MINLRKIYAMMGPAKVLLWGMESAYVMSSQVDYIRVLHSLLFAYASSIPVYTCKVYHWTKMQERHSRQECLSRVSPLSGYSYAVGMHFGLMCYYRTHYILWTYYLLVHYMVCATWHPTCISILCRDDVNSDKILECVSRNLCLTQFVRPTALALCSVA